MWRGSRHIHPCLVKREFVVFFCGCAAKKSPLLFPKPFHLGEFLHVLEEIQDTELAAGYVHWKMGERIGKGTY
jgi:hypothetical protein